MEQNGNREEMEVEPEMTSNKGTLFKAVAIGIAVGVFFMVTAKFVSKVLN